MAASANPPGKQDGAHAGSSFQGGGAVVNPVNGNSGAAAAAPDNSALALALSYEPVLALEGTPEEQSILEEGLAKYASDSSIIRYAKIAMQLDDKHIRDVALRCRWTLEKKNGQGRKDDHSKKNSEKP